DDLIKAVVDEFGEKLSGALGARFLVDLKLRELLKAHVSVLAEYEGFYMRLVLESQTLPPHIRSVFYSMNASLSYRFYRAAKAEIDKGIIKKMTQVHFFNTWMGLVHYYIMNRDLFSEKTPILTEVGEDLLRHFFHLITGEDFPARTVNDFLNLDTTKNYVDHFEMPAACWKLENGGFDRLKYYRLYDKFNTKKRIESFIISAIYYFQKVIKIERSFSSIFPKKLYGGSTYWSLNREALQYVTDYTVENKWFLERFNYTFCPEEIYFQTILINSIHSSKILNNNLRFIDWLSGRDGYPSYLDESDFDKIILSENFFARKIRNSQHLKILLTRHCQQRG
ncbi:hypothetical protein EON73_04555, partial [bacterium]